MVKENARPELVGRFPILGLVMDSVRWGGVRADMELSVASFLAKGIRAVSYGLFFSRYLFRQSFFCAKTGLLALLSYLYLVLFVCIDRWFFGFSSDWGVMLLGGAFCPVALLNGYLLLGHVTSGVEKIDCGANMGIGFGQTMEMCENSFKFIGVGGAKLTECEAEFRAMVSRCKKNNGEIKFIVCDPSSAVIKKMEGIAAAPNMQFKNKVASSISLMRSVESGLGYKGGEAISIRKYKADDYRNMPSFRIAIIDDRLCLVCGGYYGMQNHGVDIPQMLIGKDRHPALFNAFKSYFEWFWDERCK